VKLHINAYTKQFCNTLQHKTTLVTSSRCINDTKFSFLTLLHNHFPQNKRRITNNTKKCIYYGKPIILCCQTVPIKYRRAADHRDMLYMYCILTRFCTKLRLPTCIKELMMMMMTRRRSKRRPVPLFPHLIFQHTITDTNTTLISNNNFDFRFPDFWL